MRRRTLVMLVLFVVSSIVLFVARSTGLQPYFNRDSKNKPPVKIKDPSDIDVLGVKLSKLLEREKEASGPFANYNPTEFLMVLNENGVDIYQIDADRFDLSKLRSKKVTVNKVSHSEDSSTLAHLNPNTITVVNGSTTTERPKRNIHIEKAALESRITNTLPTLTAVSVEEKPSLSDREKTEEWSLAETTTTLNDFEMESNRSDDEISYTWSIKSTTTTANDYSSDSDDSVSNVTLTLADSVNYNPSSQNSRNNSLFVSTTDIVTLTSINSVSNSVPVLNTDNTTATFENPRVRVTTKATPILAVVPVKNEPLVSRDKIEEWSLTETSTTLNNFKTQLNRSNKVKTNITSVDLVSDNLPVSSTVNTTTVLKGFRNYNSSANITENVKLNSVNSASPFVLSTADTPTAFKDFHVITNTTPALVVVPVKNDTSDSENNIEEWSSTESTTVDSFETESNQTDDEISNSDSNKEININATLNSDNSVSSNFPIVSNTVNTTTAFKDVHVLTNTTPALVVPVKNNTLDGEDEIEEWSSTNTSTTVDGFETESNQTDDEISNSDSNKVVNINGTLTSVNLVSNNSLIVSNTDNTKTTFKDPHVVTNTTPALVVVPVKNETLNGENKIDKWSSSETSTTLNNFKTKLNQTDDGISDSDSNNKVNINGTVTLVDSVSNSPLIVSNVVNTTENFKDSKSTTSEKLHNVTNFNELNPKGVAQQGSADLL